MTVLIVRTPQMIRLLHDQHALSDRFIAYWLARNIRVKADGRSVVQFPRGAAGPHAAGYGQPEQAHRMLPRISQETLAERIRSGARRAFKANCASGVPEGTPLTCHTMARAYLKDDVLQRYRTMRAARPRVEHRRGFLAAWPLRP